MLAASRPRDEKPKDRLGLQHRADVASAAPGRGLATADILTGGRTILGVGRGYHTREVETFGAPMLNQEASRKLFEEQVEIIFKAFNEESFSHQGKHYSLPPRVPYRGYELEKLTLAAGSRVLSAAVRRRCKPADYRLSRRRGSRG